VFSYSDEEGTPAYELANRVPSRVKQARRRRLMSLQKRISLRRNRRRLGEHALVLVEGTHPDTDLLLRGRTAQQAPEIDGSVLINDTGDQRLAAGEFVTVELTEAHPYDLVGRVVEAGGVRRPA